MPKKAKWGAAPFIIESDGTETVLVVTRRDRCALEYLIAAGKNGCTPICSPGPRWSAYVHNLSKMGVSIETLNEPHGGPFSGAHVRYVLRCTPAPAQNGGAT
ncbi:winged helix domain-containing protein [Kordiimonas sp.]|uniref:winged helix domain-containing protein n=1 Tax=Kordiimonas sp. TaxID=1970157 RepID=UPI003A921186